MLNISNFLKENKEFFKEVNLIMENGSSCKDAIKIVADKYNLQKNEVYRIYHN